MVRTYKPKGSKKKTSEGTRGWLSRMGDGKTKLPVDRMTRYQIVGRTPSGKLKLEIVVNKDGFFEGIGSPSITITEEEWNKRFTINAPKGVKDIQRTRKAGESQRKGGVVVNPKGAGGGSGEKKVQGKAAKKIQRAVRRKIEGVKRVRRRRVAEEELFAPGMREKLGKPKKKIVEEIDQEDFLVVDIDDEGNVIPKFKTIQSGQKAFTKKDIQLQINRAKRQVKLNKPPMDVGELLERLDLKEQRDKEPPLVRLRRKQEKVEASLRDRYRADRAQDRPVYDYNRAAAEWRQRGGSNK